MRNKIILAMAAVGMMGGTSAFAANTIATTDAGGGDDDLQWLSH